MKYDNGNYIKVNEIFYDIEGEGRYQGYSSLFIRLTGCNLRCKWCDTKNAYDKGDLKKTAELLKAIRLSPYSYVNITGGEPLCWKEEVVSLIKRVHKLRVSKIKGFDKIISVETNGAVSIKGVPADNISMDLKLPSSGEHTSMLLSNLKMLKAKDQLKLVIGSNADMEHARQILKENPVKCVVFAQPVYGSFKLEKIRKFVLKNNLNWKVSIQLHKCV